MLIPTNPVHTCLSPGESFVHCASLSGTRRMYTTAEFRDILVPVAGRNLPRPPLHTQSAERTWEMGTLRRSCKESRPTHRPTEVPGPKRDDHSRMATKVGSTKAQQNPPQMERIPATLEYLRILAIDTAYIAPPGQGETPKAYKRRIYNTMLHLLRAESEPQVMRIVRLWPTTEWKSLWKNLHTAPAPETTKSTWYRVIHGVIPTHERLHKIRLAPTDRCKHCEKQDTLPQRLVECGEGIVTWEWTRERIALMLRTDPRWISTERLGRPQFKLWPPHCHRTILWTLANLVLYRTQQQRTFTLHDFLDFLRRKKWKIYQLTGRLACVPQCPRKWHDVIYR